MLIAPECSAPGCHHSGDHHTMVKCCVCGQWYCEEHLASDATERSERVPTIRLMDTGAHGLTYYLGYCMDCVGKQAARPAVNSSWLR